MTDNAIKQHQRMARGESIDTASIEQPFKSGFNHGAPARGQLLDSQRCCSRGGKINHGSYED